MPAPVYPDELLGSICATIFSSANPPQFDSLDPLIETDYGIPTALPSTLPSPSWPKAVARKTLVNLTLVNKAWYHAAKPWLWRQVEVRLPGSWLALVDEITGGEDQVDEQATQLVDKSIREAVHAAVVATSHQKQDPDIALRLQESILKGLAGPPESSIPSALLSPPASREPSPARPKGARTQSPGRWRVIRAVSNAVQNAVEPGLYIATPQDSRPGRHIQHLDFNHFRTIGMRRSVGEGMSSRFVTSERLELALKELPNLTAFGATEYMDGALTLPVLTELLFRGVGRASRERRRLDRKRNPSPEERRESDTDWARRRDCKALESLDLCGCVSVVFVNALTEFVTAHLPAEPSEQQEELRGRREANENVATDETPVTFPYLQRLGLRGVTSVPPSILTSFVLAFPSLTHLDLSGTRCTPELLAALADSPSVRLTSLALARCTRLTSSSIASLLISGSATREIEQLSLYGDATFPSPLEERDLDRIIVEAPCFRTGQLRYLDLSSCPVTPSILESFASQPSLRSLGLSHIPSLPLSAITHFLSTRASAVEILTLVSTSPELGPTANLRQVSIALHSRVIGPLCTPPVSFSLKEQNKPSQTPATHLRVIELSTASLNALGGGACCWRVVRSKGGRGWYVDTASGWVADSGREAILRRDLGPNHPLRVEYSRLADANGNVSSGVGWFSRKMEVLHGQGLLGRESGLYGAVAFAFT